MGSSILTLTLTLTLIGGLIGGIVNGWRSSLPTVLKAFNNNHVDTMNSIAVAVGMGFGFSSGFVSDRIFPRRLKTLLLTGLLGCVLSYGAFACSLKFAPHNFFSLATSCVVAGA